MRLERRPHLSDPEGPPASENLEVAPGRFNKQKEARTRKRFRLLNFLKSPER
jgi:hypothetical protein